MASELDRLVAEQAQDVAEQRSRWRRWRKSRKRREVPAADLGPHGEAIIRGATDTHETSRWHAPEDGEPIYLLGCRPWEAWQHREPSALVAKIASLEERGEDADDPLVCPVCHDHPLPWSAVCLGPCARSGKDGRVRFRGAPVELPERRAYRPGKYKGGVGKV